MFRSTLNSYLVEHIQGKVDEYQFIYSDKYHSINFDFKSLLKINNINLDNIKNYTNCSVHRYILKDGYIIIPQLVLIC